MISQKKLFSRWGPLVVLYHSLNSISMIFGINNIFSSLIILLLLLCICPSKFILSISFLLLSSFLVFIFRLPPEILPSIFLYSIKTNIQSLPKYYPLIYICQLFLSASSTFIVKKLQVSEVLSLGDPAKQEAPQEETVSVRPFVRSGTSKFNYL